MNESSMAFGGSRSDAPAPAEATGTGSRRRSFTLLGGLLAAVAAGACYAVVVLGGDEASTPVAPVAAESPVPSAAESAPSDAPAPATPALDDPIGRDPFRPLVVEDAALPAAGDLAISTTATTSGAKEASSPATGAAVASVPAGSDPVVATTTADTGAATTSTAATSSGSPTTAGVTSGATGSTGPVAIELVDVSRRNDHAHLLVNGRKVTVKAGQQVASGVTAVSFADSVTATFRHGQATFELREGAGLTLR